MKKIVLAMMVSLLVLAGCSKPADKDLFTMVEIDDVREKLEAKEDFMLVIGRDTCPACVSYKVVLNEVIKNKKIDIFYLEVIESVWTSADYDTLSDFLEKEMGQIITGYPTTYFVEAGVVTGNKTGMIDYKILVDELVDRGLVAE